MTSFYNRSSDKEKRRQLRNNMPLAEVLLWSRIKGRQLLGCKFRRQHGVGAFVLDFYAAEITLGIEIDGDSHFREGAAEYDQRRSSFLEKFKIDLIRILNTDVYDNMDGVLEMLGREIVARREAKSRGT
jgi:very-short-patch-repair endonuclease